MCSQGAIIEVVPVSIGELRTTVVNLKERTDDLIGRIERLRL